MLAVLSIWIVLAQEHPIFCSDGGRTGAGHISRGRLPRRDIPRWPATARPRLQPRLPAALEMVCAGMVHTLPIQLLLSTLESPALLHASLP